MCWRCYLLFRCWLNIINKHIYRYNNNKHILRFEYTNVYFFNSTQWKKNSYADDLKYLGCWKATAEIPSLEGTDILLDGNANYRENALDKCKQVAKKREYCLFGLQDGGKCVGSATMEHVYQKNGKSQACPTSGKGGAGANSVYKRKLCSG